MEVLGSDESSKINTQFTELLHSDEMRWARKRLKGDEGYMNRWRRVSGLSPAVLTCLTRVSQRQVVVKPQVYGKNVCPRLVVVYTRKWVAGLEAISIVWLVVIRRADTQLLLIGTRDSRTGTPPPPRAAAHVTSCWATWPEGGAGEEGEGGRGVGYSRWAPLTNTWPGDYRWVDNHTSLPSPSPPPTTNSDQVIALIVSSPHRLRPTFSLVGFAGKYLPLVSVCVESLQPVSSLSISG